MNDVLSLPSGSSPVSVEYRLLTDASWPGAYIVRSATDVFIVDVLELINQYRNAIVMGFEITFSSCL